MDTADKYASGEDNGEGDSRNRVLEAFADDVPNLNTGDRSRGTIDVGEDTSSQDNLDFSPPTRYFDRLSNLPAV